VIEPTPRAFGPRATVIEPTPRAFGPRATLCGRSETQRHGTMATEYTSPVRGTHTHLAIARFHLRYSVA
jgi:hypothetical protein